MAALKRMAAEALRLAAEACDMIAEGLDPTPSQPSPVAYASSGGEAAGMYVLDFRTGEVRLNGEVIGHG